MNPHYLRPLLDPRSVVLVGATPLAEKVGGRLLENLLGGGFAGEILAVNPKYHDIRGIPCFPSIEDLPRAVDLAVIATPAPTVPRVVQACGRRGIRAAVVITAGFRETGPQGMELERRLLEAAHAGGVRLLGPNCVGLMRPPAGLNATFARGNALPGSLALVSQSGAVCTALLDWATPNGIGFSSVVSLGGSSDIDFGEVIDYLACDEKTEHILLYIEGVRDGRRLVSSLRAVARGKPIILMKVGRHPVGSRAAATHTGSIVGRDDVFDAVVRRTGVVRVKTAGELIAAAQALAAHVRPAGDQLAIVTNGGGPGVMAADRAADLGLPLATLAPATIERMRAALPANWSHGNPVDVIGDAGPERYRSALAACLDDPGVNGVVVILVPQAMTEAGAVGKVVAEAAAKSDKPVLACWMGEATVEAARREMRSAGLSVYRLPEMAVEGFAYLAQFHRHQRALLEAPPPLAHREPPDLARARAIVARVLGEGRSLLTGTESKEFLEAFRIPVVRSIDARDMESAVAAARATGFPVVMKILSRDITHKSDVGGVRLGLADEGAVRAAWEAMMAAVAARQPQARIDGVSIERMVASAHGRELMVGVVTDEVFGPAISFGAGGIAVEVLRDRVVGLPPLSAALIDDMVRGTRVAKMLGKFRHLPAVDRRALEAVLLRVSEMATALPQLVELDINPLVADEYGVLALDARVVVRAPAPGLGRYGHLAIHPYPDELEENVRLRDGTGLLLRPIRPEDAAMEAAFVEALSSDSRRMRFQSALRALTPTMLARFTQIDYDREMALVAIDASAAQPREVGVCRYIRLPDERSCEFAIVVADAWQGRGLGRVMMERLIAIARERGLERMLGYVLSANRGMLELCSRLGFEIRAMADGEVREVVLQLGAADLPAVDLPDAATSPRST
jgi:acetyltransferase